MTETNNMQHLIKKQIIDLRLDKKLDAFRMQHLVSTHYNNIIVPALGKLFDEFSDNDEVIQLDLLEIDLGILNDTGIENGKWYEGCITAIMKQLREQIGSRSAAMSKLRETRILNCCRQWLYYMQRGHLPWNVLRTDENWYREILEALAVDFESVTELRSVIKKKPLAVIRITEQHTEEFLIKLIEIFTAEKQSELPVVFGEIYEFFKLCIRRSNQKVYSGRKEFQKSIWPRVITIAAGTEKNQTIEKLAEKIIASLFPDTFRLEKIPVSIKSKWKIILPALQQFEKKAITGKKLKPAKKNRPGENINEKEHSEIKSDPGGLDSQTSGEDKFELLKEPSVLSDPAVEELLTATDSEIKEDGIFVQHAGLVLLHPFLHSLFKCLQLTKEGGFANRQAQQKALHLLYYAATGNIKPEEHELVIPKILCVWPLQLPVEKEIEPTADELSEADNMLQAVIEHWTALKTTSPDGLREGFLQRNGKLFIRNNEQHLRIENSSIDILLDQLPWNLSMIKLPWMKEILRVEWR